MIYSMLSISKPVRIPRLSPLLGELLPVELMNTIWADRTGGHDALFDARGLRRWLDAVRDRLDLDGLPGSSARRVTPDQFVSARELRDALRCLAAVATDDPRAGAPASERAHRDAVRTVNEACARAPMWSTLEWRDEPRRIPRSAQPAVEVALARIAEQAVDLFSGPRRADLRACLAPGCVLYFLRDDRRREWCSPACGNRARVARHYRRHKLG